MTMKLTKYQQEMLDEGAHDTSGTIGKSRSSSLMFSKKIPSGSLIA